VRVPFNRGGIRNYLIVIGLFAGYTSPFWIITGLPLLLAGTAIHLWAKGCLHQDREVTQSGPYRYVRHPFYFDNALIDMGLAVMSGWWLLQITLPLWWTAIYLPVMRSEEALNGEFTADTQPLVADLPDIGIHQLMYNCLVHKSFNAA